MIYLDVVNTNLFKCSDSLYNVLLSRVLVWNVDRNDYIVSSLNW